MAGPIVALLASPLLGPAAWEPVATELRRAGWSVVVPDRPSRPPHGPDDVLGHLDAALPGTDLVLVPHSNAGLYVPALTTLRPVRGYVFVDAGLPPPHGSVPLAPPALLETLAGMADPDGNLPLWTEWWDEADIGPLFPDAATRIRVSADQSRLPIAYFRSTVAVPTGWDARPGAYLAFGETYAGERDRATARNWPTRTVPGGHLHVLVDPVGVARHIHELLTVIMV